MMRPPFIESPAAGHGHRFDLGVGIGQGDGHGRLFLCPGAVHVDGIENPLGEVFFDRLSPLIVPTTRVWSTLI